MNFMSPLIRIGLWAGLASAATTTTRADYAVGTATVPAAVIRSEADFAVYGGHPRLFFRDTDLPAIRARITGDFRAAWDEMRGKLETGSLKESPARYAASPYLK